MPTSVVVRDDKLRALIRDLPKNAAQDVSDAAHDLRDYASAVAPVDTGALRQSIYVSGPGDDSDYGERSSGARSLNPLAHIVDEIRPEEVDQDVSTTHPVAVIAPSVNYGIFNELGTRYMAPRPFMFPAVEAIRDRFVDLIKKVADV